jgi:hypothetical protein
MLTDYKQILFLADTASLSTKRKDDAKQILVLSNGTYEWAATGTADGISTFAALGSGYWVRKVTDTLATAGGQTEVFAWAYDSVTTASDPGVGKFRLKSAASIPAIDAIYIDDVTYDIAMDVSAMFAKVKGDWLLHVQQSNDATKFVQFNITGDPVDNTGWWTIPISYIQHSGGIVNGQKCTFVFVNQNNSATGGGGQSQIQFKDEGTNIGALGAITGIDFVGSGVTASVAGTNLTVTIPGGGGGGGGGTESKGVVIDGMGATIIASNTSYGYTIVPYAATITGWDVQADISGSIVFDVKISGTSIIGAGNKPTLTSQITNAAAVSGWTDITLAANDKLEFIAVSAATVTMVTLTLFLTRI